MKGFRDRNPYAIGIGSVLVIGAFVGIAFLIGIVHLFEKSYSVRGEFADAGGISAGDSVRVAGIKAGRVTGIRADRRRGLVFVSWNVNKGVRLGPNTRAEIALETLLGRKFIRLTGKVEAPYLEDVPKAQRVIPRDRTKTPFDLFDLVTVGTRNIEATDTEKLNTFIRQIGDVTADKQDQIRQLLDGLAKVSAAVNQRDTQVRQLFDNFSSLSKTLAEKDETLVSLIDQSQGVLNLVSRRRDDIARALGSSDQLFGQLSGIVGVNRSTLDAILETLHPTIDILDRRQRQLDRALTWVGPGALGLSKAAAHGPWQDIYVRSVGPDVVAILGNLLGSAP